jgi:succinyl-diaminopimelate desuccinylase
MDYYKKVAKMPDEGFTPDADFPVIYAEKGILHFATAFEMENPPFTALKAGERVNMVCDLGTAVLTRKAAERLVGYENDVVGTTFSYDNTTNILKVYGKSAHGSNPKAGANALEAMMKFFASFHEGCKRAYELLFADCTGLKTLQDETGALTISPDVALFEKGVLTITSDVRFPATLTKEKVLEKLAGYSIQEVNYQPPIYNDPNGKLISTLVSVYNKATHRNEKPIAIGGGTYARALKNGCAFGPIHVSDESVAHQPNEYITLDCLRQITEIYYEAVKELTK